MPRRRIGDATVRLSYRSASGYSGTVTARGVVWRFVGVRPARDGYGPGVGPDHPAAYDAKALWVVGVAASGAACGVDSYPDGVADAVLDAVAWSVDEQGRFTVHRLD